MYGLSPVATSSKVLKYQGKLEFFQPSTAFDAAGYIQSVTAPDGTALSAGQVSIESPVDTSVPGTYHVGYSVTAQGQSYTVYLAVVVE